MTILDQKVETMNEQPIERPIRAAELRERLDISRTTEMKYREKGIIKAHKLGGRVYYLWSEVMQELLSA